MSMVKDGYDILFDLHDRITGRNGRNLILSKHLEAIASLLDAASEKLKNRQVPRREAKELATLINHTEDLAAVWQRYGKLALSPRISNAFLQAQATGIDGRQTNFVTRQAHSREHLVHEMEAKP